MVAAEAKHPSVYLKTAFTTLYYRFGAFFILGALAVGIVVPYNDEILQAVWLGAGGGKGTAAASLYVIAMENLGTSVLQHTVNALILTSIFSAGNTYVYCASRALYSLSLDGRAPRILSYCTSKGVPIYCFAIVMLFSFLSFLQAHSGSAVVLTWLASIITGGILISYIIISITFLNYYRACQVQGVERRERPYYGYFQPYGTYVALVFLTLVLLGYGYYAFRPSWNVETFFQSYSMQILSVILFFGWKIINKTDSVTPDKVELVWERPRIDRYEDATTEPPLGFWEEMIHIVGFPTKKGMLDA
jgi:amino acid transporter